MYICISNNSVIHVNCISITKPILCLYICTYLLSIKILVFKKKDDSQTRTLQ